MQTVTKAPAKWYTHIIQSIQQLCEQFGLDEQMTQSFRDLAITIARDEFKAGNRSGIRWARENPNGKPQTAGVVG